MSWGEPRSSPKRAANDGQGGLIALSVAECDVLLDWYQVAADWGGLVVAFEDEALHLRLREWRSRHVPVGGTTMATDAT